MTVQPPLKIVNLSKVFDTPAGPFTAVKGVETNVHAGEFACIRTPNGPRLARCAKVSNLSSWRFLKNGCGPTARRSTPIRYLLAILPPAAK